MIAKNKAKFITNCVDGPLVTGGVGAPTTISPVITGAGNNGTVIATGEGGGKSGRGVNCHKTGAMIGAIYIAGPGGWVILHISWILMVVLYAKALRRHYAADEEQGYVKMAPLAAASAGHGLNRSLPKQHQYQLEDRNNKGAVSAGIEPVSGFHVHQNHPFQLDNASRRSSCGGLGVMFRNIRPWSSPSKNSSTVQESPSNNKSGVSKSKDKNISKAMHVIDEDDMAEEEEERDRSRTSRRQGRNSNTSITITITNNHDATPDHGHDSDSSSDDDENDKHHRNRLTRLGTSNTDNSLSSRTDIPADGKGWWIRQIEGKRRGEICPCTLEPRESRDFGPCWCGKERCISSQAGGSCSAVGLVVGSSSSGSTSSTSIAPTHSQIQHQ